MKLRDIKFISTGLSLNEFSKYYHNTNILGKLLELVQKGENNVRYIFYTK